MGRQNRVGRECEAFLSKKQSNFLLEIDKSNLKDIGKKGYQYAYKNFKMENIINNLFKL